MPTILGPGDPARRSCSRMYCLSNSLTGCQSTCNSGPHPSRWNCDTADQRKTQTASCKAGCRPGSRVAPASPCRTADRRRAAPPVPGKSGHPRRRGPGQDGSCCRNNSGARSRNIHIRFFLTPLHPDDPGLRITKHPLEFGLRTPPGERVAIQQSPDCSHPSILPKFSWGINLVSPFP